MLIDVWQGSEYAYGRRLHILFWDSYKMAWQKLFSAKCSIIDAWQSKIHPVVFPDTGRKLNVHKTFGRRSGRLLNILCMFNLRLLSRGWGEYVNENNAFTSGTSATKASFLNPPKPLVSDAKEEGRGAQASLKAMNAAQKKAEQLGKGEWKYITEGWFQQIRLSVLFYN